MRFGPVEHRVAPTAKMSDDASYPAPAAPIASPVPGSLSAPAYGSLPGRAASQPPRAASEPPVPARSPASSFARTTPRGASAVRPPAPEASSASGSLAVPGRPLGLIVLVLIVDLALAGAGAVMLIKGLGG